MTQDVKPPVIPSEIVNGEDKVKYASITKGILTDHGTPICYSNLMSQLTTVGLYLYPHNKPKTCLSQSLYYQWINLCKEYNMVAPTAVVYTTGDKNYLVLEGGQFDKYVVYTTLCCYRFSDAYAKLCWVVLELVNKQKVTFWQALHYALGTEYQYSNEAHNFTRIHGRKGTPYDSWQRHDLAQSIALKWWMERPIAERLKKTDNMNDLIQSLAIKFAGPLGKNNTPVLNLPNVADILSPKWLPLFKLTELDPSTLQKEYAKVA